MTLKTLLCHFPILSDICLIFIQRWEPRLWYRRWRTITRESCRYRCLVRECQRYTLRPWILRFRRIKHVVTIYVNELFYELFYHRVLSVWKFLWIRLCNTCSWSLTIWMYCVHIDIFVSYELLIKWECTLYGSDTRWVKTVFWWWAMPRFPLLGLTIMIDLVHEVMIKTDCC